MLGLLVLHLGNLLLKKRLTLSLCLCHWPESWLELLAALHYLKLSAGTEPSGLLLDNLELYAPPDHI